MWERLQAEGGLWVDPSQPGFMEGMADHRGAYDWLREQMSLRVPGYTGRYPWWAYEEPKPNLRRFRHQLNPGARFVRLELAVPAEEVLLSGYSDWHFVLNRWFLAVTEEEQAAWFAEMDALKRDCGVDPYSTASLPEPWETRLRASWEVMFDVETRRHLNTVQATFEQLRLADVRGVTEFMACKRADEEL
jgi:hypothetical protein